MTSTHPKLKTWAGGTLKPINNIDRNELQIRKNSQKGTGTKMAEKLNNFEKFKRNKNKILALLSTQRPPDDWPDALNHLAICLVANKYTKLEKK